MHLGKRTNYFRKIIRNQREGKAHLFLSEIFERNKIINGRKNKNSEQSRKEILKFIKIILRN